MTPALRFKEEDASQCQVSVMVGWCEGDHKSSACAEFWGNGIFLNASRASLCERGRRFKVEEGRLWKENSSLNTTCLVLFCLVPCNACQNE